MSNSFTKLFSSITTSTIWQEDAETKVVWITMLALADQTGYIDATLPGLANIANVSMKKCEEAIKKFLSPDKYSRSQENEGRRIETVGGSFRFLNYAAYREKRDPNKRKEQIRAAQETYRAKNKDNKPIVINSNQEVINSNHSKPKSSQAEAEAEADNKDIRLDSNESRLASLLFSEIRKRKEDFKKPNLSQWSITIERMIRIDRRQPARIREVIIWCQADSGNGTWSGWQNQILCTSKLRKQFDKLELAMPSERTVVPFDEGAAAQREKMLAVK